MLCYVSRTVSRYFNGDTARDAWTPIIKEFVASMVLILVATNSGLNYGFNWAISYVVLSIMCEAHHMNSFITFYSRFFITWPVLKPVF